MKQQPDLDLITHLQDPAMQENLRRILEWVRDKRRADRVTWFRAILDW